MPLVNKSFSDIITFTRSTGGGRFNAQGQYEWLPANTPRIDYDPVTGECLGLLVEEQRTNLLLNSVVFTPSVSFPAATPEPRLPDHAGVTVTGPATIDGPGTPLSAGTTYVASVFVRVDSVSAGGNIRASISGVAEKLFPINPNDSGSLVRISSNPWVAASSIAYRGRIIVPTGMVVSLFAQQIEAGAFPTSYIPTTTAQVTRAADIASVNELSPWYNPEAGTLFVEVAPMQLISANWAVTLSNSSTGLSNLIDLGWLGENAGVRGRVISNGGTQAQHNIGPGVSVGDPLKIAIAYAANSVQTAARGVVSTEDTSAIIPAVDRLQIGMVGGYSYSAGHIRSIRYFPRRLSDESLVELTTP